MNTLNLHENRVEYGYAEGDIVHTSPLFNEQGTFGVVVSKSPFNGRESFSGDTEDSTPVQLHIIKHDYECECDDCRKIYSVYDQVRFI